ncbi:unnamed protein product [Ambrosiozyma monospora]|uniref:Unnamed protein product n=1 Tax=Ambrosiozyma monospora TaxID=43982 RepID=A0A9W6Z187_AMBMO|nr:unnamed protein product [Ambrosiozyma monospora]
MNKERIRKEQAESNAPTNKLGDVLAESWKALDTEARKPYFEIFLRDQQRYRTQMYAYKIKRESGGFDNPNDDDDDAASTASSTSTTQKKKRKKSTRKLILSAASAAAATANLSDAPLSTDPVEPMSESVEDGEADEADEVDEADDGGDVMNTTIASSPAPIDTLDVEDDVASVAEPASALDSISGGAADDDETTDEEEVDFES